MSNIFDHAVDDTWSNVAVDGRQLTWREAAAHWRDLARVFEQFRSLLLDLDRCEHGRHEGDNCTGCAGPSHGNPLLVSQGRQVGFTLDGASIVVPQREQRHVHEAWVRRD